MWLVTVLSSAYSNPITAHKLKVKVTVFFFLPDSPPQNTFPKWWRGWDCTLSTGSCHQHPSPTRQQRTHCDEWRLSDSKYNCEKEKGGIGICRRGLTFSETQEPLELSETQGPMAPQTFSSLDVYTHTQIHNVNLTCTIANVWCSKFKSVDTFDSLPWLPWRLRRPCGSRRCSLC